MRKDLEIELLANITAQTPRNSYLRSLLEHLKPQFERDIRSDFSTLPDLAELEREALALIERNRQLLRIKDDIEKDIRELRTLQSGIINRLVTAKNDLNSIDERIERIVQKFTKD